LEALQDVIYKEINLKFQAGQEAEKRPSSRLTKEVLLNNSQYQKILELMLDLEKKIERRFTETQ